MLVGVLIICYKVVIKFSSLINVGLLLGSLIETFWFVMFVWLGIVAWIQVVVCLIKCFMLYKLVGVV